MKTSQLIFGTDGVRDRAGKGLLEPSAVENIIQATARMLEDRGRFPEDFPPGRGRDVAVARDTRESGPGIQDIISRIFARAGFNVLNLGILPTPGAAWIASAWQEITLGVVISASHNAAEYNGIKFLSPTGAKISPEFEKAVSDAYWEETPRPLTGKPGTVTDSTSAGYEEYIEHLVGACRKPERLQGRTVAIDAANGAASFIAPEVFRRLGMKLEATGIVPDGRNINFGCGTLHPARLSSLVSTTGADCGFCFDGDADRMIPVTGKGVILDGDFILCLAGRAFDRGGVLAGKTVVSTVMSNIGLELALAERGIKLLRTDVGDRNVYLAMVDGGYVLGGEQSGHILFLQDARTGDGVLAALRFLDVLEGDSLDLDGESSVMKRFPQVLKNVRVSEKVPLDSLPHVRETVEAANSRLDGRGRILLRYSGTEPLARVMLEGPDLETVESLTDSICDAIRRSLPGSQ